MLRDLKEKTERDGADPAAVMEELLRNWTDGGVKLYLTSRALGYRKENDDLFLDGAYIPLASHGKRGENVIAFARKKGEKAVVTAVPRFLSRVIPDPQIQPLGDVWKESWLGLPDEIPQANFRNVLTGETVPAVEVGGKRVIALDQLFARFPAALCEGKS
jgi:(1->4)-alpha-D-glucan 1-alpha-D-glucosylmutase